jgi:hypothetical protein
MTADFWDFIGNHRPFASAFAFRIMYSLHVCRIWACSVAAVLYFASIIQAEERRDSYEWRSVVRDAAPDKSAIKCELSLPNGAQVKLGEKLTIAYRIQARVASTWIYNPFLRRRLPDAATLAVFNKDDKKYLGDLFTSGLDLRSEKAADYVDWVPLKNRDLVGAELDVFVMEPFLRPPPYLHNSTPISKPGNYYIQLIFTGRVVSAPGDPRPPELWEAFHTKWKERVYEEDYCRSNVLEIEVTK